MNIDQLKRRIAIFNDTIRFEQEMNEELTGKKIRRTNFPSDISENIARFAYRYHYSELPTWDTDSGDLDLDGEVLEVKGSIDLSAGGPCSFGPTEGWSRIYFVDGVNTFDLEYTVYEIRLSNTDEDWKNIRVNKDQTYQDQCDLDRRPRINFSRLIEQIDEDDYEIIFSGTLDDLRY
jgi:hypothetical protein